jgi:RNA-directed DNA polymerase
MLEQIDQKKSLLDSMRPLPNYTVKSLNKAYGQTLEDFAMDNRKKSKRRYEQTKLRYKRKGEDYFSPLRLQKMQNAWNASH